MTSEQENLGYSCANCFVLNAELVIAERKVAAARYELIESWRKHMSKFEVNEELTRRGWTVWGYDEQ